MATVEIDTSKRYFHRMIGCHGCAHEASDPCLKRNEHRHGGEIACILCIRALKTPEENELMEKMIRARSWSRLEFPKDMYISIERFEFDLDEWRLKRRLKEK